MNIAIVGAGKGGSTLIESLSKLDDVNIALVVDSNANAPGLSLAKKLNIHCSQSLDDIHRFSIDTIIEATGQENVVQQLYTKFSDTCKIIDSHGAQLIMFLVERDVHTLDKLNAHLEVINHTAGVVQEQLKEITSSIETMHDVSAKLTSSTEVSNKHIQESDKIIQYVNNIAKQTKILGINATIEAARAGENGKGFSVVAKEVQNLANNSAKFANEINNILIQLAEEMKKIHIEVKRLDSLSQVQVTASNHVNYAVATLIDEVNKKQ